MRPLLASGGALQGQIDRAHGVENRVPPGERHARFDAAIAQLHGPFPAPGVGCLYHLILDAPVFHCPE
jgi:hypothetical protein